MQHAPAGGRHADGQDAHCVRRIEQRLPRGGRRQAALGVAPPKQLCRRLPEVADLVLHRLHNVSSYKIEQVSGKIASKEKVVIARRWSSGALPRVFSLVCLTVARPPSPPAYQSNMQHQAPPYMPGLEALVDQADAARRQETACTWPPTTPPYQAKLSG